VDPRPVWRCAENLAPTGIRSPNRPARSQSLYRLRYPSTHDYGVSAFCYQCFGVFISGIIHVPHHLHHITLHTLCYVSSVTFLKASFASLYRDVILSDNSRHYSSIRPSRVTAGSSNFVAVIIFLSRWSTHCS